MSAPRPVRARPTQALATVALAAATLHPTPARAVPNGVTLESMDLVITLPPKPTDPGTLRFTLTYSSVAFPVSQRVDISPDRITHPTAVPVQYQSVAHEDWTEKWITLSLPPTRDEPLVVPLEWTEPVMNHLHPKFWWDRVDAMVAFPFTEHLKPVQKGLGVTVIGPLTMPSQPGWACTKDATALRCQRFFPASTTNALKDDAQKGLRVVLAKIDPERDYGIVGAQVVLWLLLFPLVAYGRVRNRPLEQPGQLAGLVIRFAVGAVAFVATMAAWAYALDGVESDPMPRNLSIAAAVTGIAGLVFGLGPKARSTLRALIGWPMLVGAFAVGPLLVLATGESVPAFVLTGLLALGAPLVMSVESKSE